MTVTGGPPPATLAPATAAARREAPGAGAQDTAIARPVAARPAFAHHSEAEMARILDFYAVAWQYEPHAFPILWNLDGDVAESFSPDFYLPELDLYLEMTTLRQKLVRKKNRKLRRLKELYPGLQVKLFYARDFRALMLKYGKLALAASLSGTIGQVGPAGSGSNAALGVAPDVLDADANAAAAPGTRPKPAPSSPVVTPSPVIAPRPVVTPARHPAASAGAARAGAARR